YFAYELPIGDILDRDIEEVIEEAQSNPASARQKLATIIDSDDPGFVVEKLIQHAQGMSGPASRALGLLVAAVGGTLPGTEEPARTDSAAIRASLLTTMLLRNLEADDRLVLADEVLNEADAAFAALVFRWLDTA